MAGFCSRCNDRGGGEKKAGLKPPFLLADNWYFCFEPFPATSPQIKSLYFYDPVDVIQINKKKDVGRFFSQLEKAKNKYFPAGYFSYELGGLFEETVPAKKSPLPYACMGIFRKKALKGRFRVPEPDEGYCADNIKMNVSAGRYKKDILAIKKLIEEGQIYQVNYTSKLNFDFHGSPYSLYRALRYRQKASYNMLFRAGEDFIASISPELFFLREGSEITVKPMKGTIKRSSDSVKDRELESLLAGDEKNRSENLMIVDLMRNDLSRISEKGSVKVKRLFEVEKYPTLYQMTSTIGSTLRKNVSLQMLFRSLFPSGSVTGAPKIRAMQVIDEKEDEPRGVYTGALGYFLPEGHSLFNVAIRTLRVKGRKGSMGVGGGIVYDSDPEKEYREANLKGKFLTGAPAGGFDLVESILFRGELPPLGPHLERMACSAGFFKFKFNRQKAKSLLEGYLPRDSLCRLRFICSADGRMGIKEVPFKEPRKIKLAISEKKTDPFNTFLYHKTTCRPIYRSELAKARERGFYDTLFFNINDYLCEGARTNVYIKIKGELLTPPLSCGLLNGTVRKKLIKQGKAVEKKIGPKELKAASGVYVSNASIGLREAFF